MGKEAPRMDYWRMKDQELGDALRSRLLQVDSPLELSFVLTQLDSALSNGRLSKKDSIDIYRAVGASALDLKTRTEDSNARHWFDWLTKGLLKHQIEEVIEATNEKLSSLEKE